MPHHPCIVLLIHVICHKTFRFSEEFLSNFSWCHKCLLYIFLKVSPRYSVPHFTFSGSVTSILFPSDCLWAVSLSLSPTVLSTSALSVMKPTFNARAKISTVWWGYCFTFLLSLFFHHTSSFSILSVHIPYSQAYDCLPPYPLLPPNLPPPATQPIAGCQDPLLPPTIELAASHPQVSQAIILITRGAPEGGMLQS